MYKCTVCWQHSNILNIYTGSTENLHLYVIHCTCRQTTTCVHAHVYGQYVVSALLSGPSNVPGCDPCRPCKVQEAEHCVFVLYKMTCIRDRVIVLHHNAAKPVWSIYLYKKPNNKLKHYYLQQQQQKKRHVKVVTSQCCKHFQHAYIL